MMTKRKSCRVRFLSAVAAFPLSVKNSGHHSYSVICDWPDFLLENLHGSD